MTDHERERVRSAIQSEGFSYAFIHYSAFRDVEDPEFHRLREAYCIAHEALQAYIGED